MRIQRGHLPIVLLLACFVAIATARSPASAAPLHGGVAAVDVTPTQFPVLVNGYFNPRIADRAHDRPMSRAIVLDDGSTRLAIVVVDSLMLPRDLLDRAKEMASQKTKIPPERMLISATHTHSAPAAAGVLNCTPYPLGKPILPRLWIELHGTGRGRGQQLQLVVMFGCGGELAEHEVFKWEFSQHCGFVPSGSQRVPKTHKGQLVPLCFHFGRPHGCVQFPSLALDGRITVGGRRKFGTRFGHARALFRLARA
ncbi:hypothetical protein OAS39_01575 [Pirellulales bacterium]|nr:hypothetical protein [Pirellulales bacterium]